MPEITIGTADVSAITPEIIANESLGAMTSPAVLVNAITHDTSLQMAREGDTVKVGKRGALTANQKTSKEVVTLQEPAADAATVSLEHWEVSFSLEDLVKTYTKDSLTLDLGYISDAMLVLQDKIENKIAALFADATLTEIGDGTDEFNEDLILEARQGMITAPVADRYVALGGRAMNKGLKLDRFTRADAYGQSGVIANGALGKIHSFNAIESEHIPFTTGVGAVEKNAAFHKWGIVLATRQIQSFAPAGSVKIGFAEKNGIMYRTVISYNANLLATQITVDTLFGVGFLRKDLVNRILTTNVTA